jgi:hypothetical protein
MAFSGYLAELSVGPQVAQGIHHPALLVDVNDGAGLNGFGLSIPEGPNLIVDGWDHFVAVAVDVTHFSIFLKPGQGPPRTTISVDNLPGARFCRWYQK